MNKKVRSAVFNKFNGRCAYTGKPLDSTWQVDHAIPAYLYYMGAVPGNPNDIGNLLPTFKIINHYKRAQYNIEHFRRYMLLFHERLQRLPKNPRSDKYIRRKVYMLTIADLFDITSEKPFSGKFYFETINTLTNE